MIIEISYQNKETEYLEIEQMTLKEVRAEYGNNYNSIKILTRKDMSIDEYFTKNQNMKISTRKLKDISHQIIGVIVNSIDEYTLDNSELNEKEKEYIIRYIQKIGQGYIDKNPLSSVYVPDLVKEIKNAR